MSSKNNSAENFFGGSHCPFDEDIGGALRVGGCRKVVHAATAVLTSGGADTDCIGVSDTMREDPCIATLPASGDDVGVGVMLTEMWKLGVAGVLFGFLAGRWSNALKFGGRCMLVGSMV
jgi:hypothetical protein